MPSFCKQETRDMEKLLYLGRPSRILPAFKGRMDSCFLREAEFQFRKMKRVLEMDGVDGYTVM